MDPLFPQPGSTIDPRNAVGRAATTARARDELRSANNLALTDPRRMGKTVWLDLFCTDPGDGLTSVKIDYEGVQTSEEFLTRTVAALSAHRGLPRHAASKLKALFEGIEIEGPVKVKVGVSTRTPTDLLSEAIRSVDDPSRRGGPARDRDGRGSPRDQQYRVQRRSGCGQPAPADASRSAPAWQPAALDRVRGRSAFTTSCAPATPRRA